MMNKTRFSAALLAILLLSVLAPDSPARVKKAVEQLKLSSTVELPPAGWTTFKYEPSSNSITEVRPETPAPFKEHADNMAKAIERAPKWLRRGLERKLSELLFCAIKVKASAAVAFGDVNGDSKPDLVVGDADGNLKAFIAPYWTEGKGLLKNISVPGNASPCFIDVNGDSKLDLVTGDAQGRLRAFLAPDFSPAPSNPSSSIVLGPNASPAAVDINGDGRVDIVCGDSEGKLHAIMNGNWAKAVPLSPKIDDLKKGRLFPGAFDADNDGRPELALADSDGKFICFSIPKLDRVTGLLDKADLGQDATFVAGDCDNDGMTDLAVGGKDGFVTYYPNIGTPGKPFFNIFKHDEKLLFGGLETGFECKPFAFDENGDGADEIVLVDKTGRAQTILPTRNDKPAMPKFNYGSPAPAPFSSIDGKVKGLLTGYADGSLVFYKSPNFEPDKTFISGLSSTGYAAPAFGDLDGDKDLDLVIGCIEGTLKVYKNMEKETGKISFTDDTANSPIGKLKSNNSSAPALGDLDSDGLADLLLGAQNGGIRLFMSPNWSTPSDALADVDVGELSSPSIYIGKDGRRNIVACNSLGTVLFLEDSSSGGKPAWAEKYSKDMSPVYDKDKADPERNYYDRYYRERPYLMGANDGAVLNDYCKMITDCDQSYIDEIAFCVAETSSEMLRAMSRLKESEILVENAKGIYDFVKGVKYARLVEREDHTTIEYAIEPGAWKAVDKDIYYWWVVFPKVGFEIPLKVDSSWWENTAEKYSMTKEEWLKFNPNEPEIYTLSPKASFWRTSMPSDKHAGKTLATAMKNSVTLRDAVEDLHYWIAGASPEGLMSFGYLTDDLQPLVIFRKRYGSCGEHSIVCAASARTALIPTAVVTKRGEDHQWNEFFMDGKWYQWDICGWPDTDRPWGPEGRYHQYGAASTITRWWGNDLMDETTTTVANTVKDYTKKGSGYTDTADVRIRVVDKSARPVEGALVVIRSHDGPSRRITIWGYTGADGSRLFQLGQKGDGGFTIEVVSPWGTAGIENYPVQELKSYEVTLSLEGAITSPRGELLGSPDKSELPADTKTALVKVSVSKPEGLLYPPNFIGSQVKRMKSESLKAAEYIGVVKYPQPVEFAGSARLYAMDAPNFAKMQLMRPFKVLDSWKIDAAGTFDIEIPSVETYLMFANPDATAVHKKFEAELSTVFPFMSPRMSLATPGPFEIKTGETVKIEGSAKDNAGIAKIMCETNGSGEWADITKSYDPATGRWNYEFDAGKGGPAMCGTYSLAFKAVDVAGNEAVCGPVTITVKPSMTFLSQKIYQDDPNDPLNECSWVLGPFVMQDKERMISIFTDTRSSGFDMDMWLYADKNGNGRLDGVDEKIADCATPSSKEKIALSMPADTIYWLHCQGWEVDDEPALLDVRLSFNYRLKFIVNYSPVGHTKDLAPEIKAEFMNPFGMQEGAVKLSVDGTDLTARSIMTPKGISFKPAPGEFTGNIAHKVRLEFRDRSGNTDASEWTFTIDDSAPVIESADIPDGKEVGGKIKISIKTTDASGMAKVVYSIDGGDKKEIARPADEKADQSVYSSEISLLAVADGEHKMLVTALDKAGNEQTVEAKFTVKNPDLAVEKTQPAEGEKVRDDRPAIKIFLKSKKTVDFESLRFILDGNDLSPKCKHSDKDGVKQVIYPTLESMPVGKHVVEFSIKDVDGAELESYKFEFETTE